MRYEERRADGWPLCPECGEDELYSLAMPKATEATIEGCYRCGWKPATVWEKAIKSFVETSEPVLVPGSIHRLQVKGRVVV